MKVLHVIHSMDPRSGGPSHAIREMVRAQKQLDLSPSVLTTNAQAAVNWDDDSAYRESIMSEPLFGDVPLQIATAYGKRRPWSRYSWSHEAPQMLTSQLSGSCRPDVVHIHGVFSHITQKAAQLAHTNRIPYIIRPAGALDLGCLQRGSARLKRLFIKTMLTRAIERSAFVHVTSEKEVDSIRIQFPRARTEVLPHGTSMDDPNDGVFKANHPSIRDQNFVLCLSRIHPIKRLDLAIRAFHAVSTEYPTTQLVIAGNDAGALAGLKELVSELQLNDRCLFSGFVSGVAKARAYSEARALLHTSAHENFGLSVVEAMAYGCPVIATDGVASGVYVATANAGFVVPSDVEQISTALRTVLTGSRDEIGKRGADYVQQNLTWPRIAQRLTDLYQNAINRTSESSQ